MRTGTDAGSQIAPYNAGVMNISYLVQPILDVPSGDVMHYEVLSRPSDLAGADSLESFFESMSAAQQFEIIHDQLIHFAPSHLPVSVNVSGRLLHDPQMCFRLIELLGDLSMPVMLELTEGHPLPTPDVVNPYFRQLRKVGCVLALDDFGTGHSANIDTIHHYDFDVIKIDRSLSNQWQDPTRSPSLALLAQVIQMLGKTAVAEGIETHEQMQGLAKLGYPQQQGYYHGRPCPLNEALHAVG